MFDVLICESEFAGESVYPLIQKVKFMTKISGKTTSILVTSSYPATELAQHLTVKVEAYLPKPIDVDCLVAEVWNISGTIFGA